MYWLLIKYLKTLFRSNNVNIFKVTGSKVIGLKVLGKLGSPFWWIKMMAALVHCTGKLLLLRTSVQVFHINDLKYGHRLKQAIDTWSNGHGEPEDLMRLIIRVISC